MTAPKPKPVRAWAPLPSIPRYEVSDDGAIRNRETGRILSTFPDKDGYRNVSLTKPGRIAAKRLVHRLVLESFVGPCPPGLECGHENGNPADNRLCNLSWITPKKNSNDRLKHGRVPLGENHKRHKATNDMVREVRIARSQGAKLRTLAEKYGVSTTTILNITKGRTWRHIA